MKLFTLKSIKIAFIILLISKSIAYFYIIISGGISIGGKQSGNDSEYYHAYATGLIDNAVNYWPVILRYLNDHGLYNRQYVSIFLFTISITAIPYFISKVVSDKKYSSLIPKKQNLANWHLMTLILFYPTLFAFTFDIYRDVFMVMIFCLSLVLSKNFIEKKEVLILIPLLLTILLLYKLRPYLGFSMLVALPLYKLKYNGKKIYIILVLYFVALAALKESNQLQNILSYRGEEGFTKGGATLGIGLLDSNIFSFTYLYLYSAAMQLFGLYITSTKALFAFVTESLFFIISFIYILRNRRFLTPFTRYLIVFSVIYGSIWILGNDNLGTAVRLRVYNYLSIYLVAATIFLEKSYYTYAVQTKKSHY